MRLRGRRPHPATDLRQVYLPAVRVDPVERRAEALDALRAGPEPPEVQQERMVRLEQAYQRAGR